MADTLTEAPAAPASGPLTIDQAVDLQMARKAKAAPADTPEEPAPVAEETGTQPEGEAATGTEENSETDTQSVEGAEGEATEPNPEGDEKGPVEPEEAIDPPKFWDAEGKESFAKLPKAAQKAVAAFEEQRTKAVDKAMRESAIARKGFEAKQAQLQAVSEEIGEFVSENEARMTEWAEWFRTPEAQALKRDNPAEFVDAQDRYNQERHALHQAKERKSKIDAKNFSIFRSEQEALLPTLIPEFGGAQADKHRSDLGKYLTGYAEGKAFNAEAVRGISAYEAQIAFKAMKHDDLEKKFAETGGLEALVRDAERYRKAEALAKKPPPPKPKTPAGPTAGATGQGQKSSSDEAAYKTLMAKKNWSPEDHVRVMTLKAKLGK